MQNEIALYAKHVQWIQHLHQFFCNNFLKKKLDILDIRAKHDKTCFYVSKMSGLLKSYTKLATNNYPFKIQKTPVKPINIINTDIFPKG